MPNTVAITASSDLLYGVGANMVVTINGVGQAPVNVSASRALGQSQTFTFDLPQGATLGSLDIAFTNDAYGGAGLDRNLWVKSVSYAGQAVSLGNAQYTSGSTTTTISSGWMPQSGTLSLDPGAIRGASAAALVAGTMITLDKTAYYVSPLGRDTWSGRLAAPNSDGTDGPLATLGAAQKKMQATAVKKTYVRGGTYDLASTISLGSVDAGVTFEGYPGETPVIRAGRAVKGWTQDPATGLWSAPVAASTLPGGKLDALYVDGVAMTRARYPNEVPSDPVKGG